jgi:integrase
MKLSEVKVRNAKPEKKPYKLGDGDGLYLLVHPAGHKYWRMKYRFDDKEKLLALGTYPEVSLAEAREKRFEVRRLKAQGIDPSELKKEKKRKEAINNGNSFETITREWIEKKSGSWTPYYARQVTQRFEKDIFPKIGHRPISAITSKEILQVAQSIEQRDAIEIAHRAVQISGQVFQYAIITDRAENNPAVALRGALKTRTPVHRAHLGRNELPEYLEKLEEYDGGTQTKLALKLLLLTFVRPSELRCTTWSEIDFSRKEWRIPAERMKMRTPHIVPLSSQALELLQILKRLNGNWSYVFPSVQAPRKCMSSNAMLFALWTMGYKGKATVHGFRGTASTILNESGLFGRDVIERQLAHMERNRVRAAYDHAEHLPARREMMQWWADHCYPQQVKKAKVLKIRA